MPIDATADGSEFAAALASELPRLVHLATRLVRDADQAEGCAQETIVGAWRRRDQLRDPASLGGWLRRSLVNRIIDRSRVHHDELVIEAVEADWRDDRYSVAPERVPRELACVGPLMDGVRAAAAIVGHVTNAPVELALGVVLTPLLTPFGCHRAAH